MNLRFKIARNIILVILIVTSINFIILYSLDFPQMALLQIKKYIILLILLVGGLGIQIGLFTYLKHKSIICGITTVTSGGISSISMILCCSHYIVNFLPFISISVASFFSRHILYILLFGIASNIFGIVFMLNKIKKIKRG